MSQESSDDEFTFNNKDSLYLKYIIRCILKHNIIVCTSNFLTQKNNAEKMNIIRDELMLNKIK